MAAADKIYGTYQQYLELRDFLAHENPEALKSLYTECWAQKEWQEDGKEHTISNFPSDIDMWLMEHCHIPFVLEALADQYGGGAVWAILTKLRAEKALEAKRLCDGMDVIRAYVAKTSHLKAPGALHSVVKNLIDMLHTLQYRDGQISLPDEEEENGDIAA